MDGRMASKSSRVLLLAFVLAICLPLSATPEEAYAVINKGNAEVERNKYEQLKNEINNVKAPYSSASIKPEIVIGEDGSITFESTPGSSQEAPSEEAIATDEPIVEEPALDDGEEITRRPYVYVPDDDDALSNSDPDGSEVDDRRYNGSWVLAIIMISAVIIHVVIAILVRRRDKRRKYRHPR